MFVCSAAYHMIPASRWTGVLQSLDHAAILPSTYTPFAAIKIGRRRRLRPAGPSVVACPARCGGKAVARIDVGPNCCPALSGAWLDWPGDAQTFGRFSAAGHACPARDRMPALYRRRRLSCVALVAIPEGRLAWFCAGGHG